MNRGPATVASRLSRGRPFKACPKGSGLNNGTETRIKRIGSPKRLPQRPLPPPPPPPNDKGQSRSHHRLRGRMQRRTDDSKPWSTSTRAATSNKNRRVERNGTNETIFTGVWGAERGGGECLAGCSL